MTCCELYGDDCAQSDTCPLRTGVVTPAQKAQFDRAMANAQAPLPVWYVTEDPFFARFDDCMAIACRALGYLTVFTLLIAALAGYFGSKT